MGKPRATTDKSATLGADKSSVAKKEQPMQSTSRVLRSAKSHDSAASDDSETPTTAPTVSVQSQTKRKDKGDGLAKKDTVMQDKEGGEIPTSAAAAPEKLPVKGKDKGDSQPKKDPVLQNKEPATPPKLFTKRKHHAKKDTVSQDKIDGGITTSAPATSAKSQTKRKDKGDTHAKKYTEQQEKKDGSSSCSYSPSPVKLHVKRKDKGDVYASSVSATLVKTPTKRLEKGDVHAKKDTGLQDKKEGGIPTPATLAKTPTKRLDKGDVHAKDTGLQDKKEGGIPTPAILAPTKGLDKGDAHVKEDTVMQEEKEGGTPTPATLVKTPTKRLDKGDAHAKKDTVLQDEAGCEIPTPSPSTPVTKRKIKDDPKEKCVLQDIAVNEQDPATDSRPSSAKQYCFEHVTAGIKIVSWNVAGLRAMVKKDGWSDLLSTNADIMCLQEVRCPTKDLPDEAKTVAGYYHYWVESTSKAGYAGCATLCKEKPLNVEMGIGDEELDKDGRIITLEYPTFFLVNTYVPNAGRGLVSLPRRLEWNIAFSRFCKKLDAEKPVIIVGDMNVAHEEIDLAKPKANMKSAGFTREEREGMTAFLGEGFVDTFRRMHPDLVGYTFWSYMGNARNKNVGWRLDYAIVSERLFEKVHESVICYHITGSDHCPISIVCNP